jgi:subfamily B ATP-binding cassette protein MsbA
MRTQLTASVPNPGGISRVREGKSRPGSADSSRKPNPEIFNALPEIWQLIRPRRGLLAMGMILMIINRVSGLVLPASTKYLVDDVIAKRHFKLLYPLVGIVLVATIIQGVTSFALTQTLSNAACRNTSGASPCPTTTPTRPACWSRAS